MRSKDELYNEMRKLLAEAIRLNSYDAPQPDVMENYYHASPDEIDAVKAIHKSRLDWQARAAAVEMDARRF